MITNLEKIEIEGYAKRFVSSSLPAVVRRTAAENAAFMISQCKSQEDVDTLYQHWDAGVRARGFSEFEIKRHRNYLNGLLMGMMG